MHWLGSVPFMLGIWGKYGTNRHDLASCPHPSLSLPLSLYNASFSPTLILKFVLKSRILSVGNICLQSFYLFPWAKTHCQQPFRDIIKLCVFAFAFILWKTRLFNLKLVPYCV